MQRMVHVLKNASIVHALKNAGIVHQLLAPCMVWLASDMVQFLRQKKIASDMVQFLRHKNNAKRISQGIITNFEMYKVFSTCI